MFFDDLESKLASDQTICKSILRDVKCPVHKLKARIIYDYDKDFTYAHITTVNILAELDNFLTETRHVSPTMNSFFLNLAWLPRRSTSSAVKLSPMTMA